MQIRHVHDCFFPVRMCDLIVWFEYNQTNIYIYVTYVHL